MKRRGCLFQVYRTACTKARIKEDLIFQTTVLLQRLSFQYHQETLVQAHSSNPSCSYHMQQSPHPYSPKYNPPAQQFVSFKAANRTKTNHFSLVRDVIFLETEQQAPELQRRYQNRQQEDYKVSMLFLRKITTSSEFAQSGDLRDQGKRHHALGRIWQFWGLFERSIGCQRKNGVPIITTLGPQDPCLLCSYQSRTWDKTLIDIRRNWSTHWLSLTSQHLLSHTDLPCLCLYSSEACRLRLPHACPTPSIVINLDRF